MTAARLHAQEGGGTGNNRHALARLGVGRFGPGNTVCGGGCGFGADGDSGGGVYDTSDSSYGCYGDVDYGNVSKSMTPYLP